MERACRKGWRSAISLIVAYLFVIQAFLAAVVVTQAAAAQAQNPDLPFVICSSQHDGANGSTSDHDQHADCCLVCTAANAATFIAPLAVALLLVLEVPVSPVAFCADTITNLIPAKPDGSSLSRAPPTTM
jgi:hypothetical protein